MKRQAAAILIMAGLLCGCGTEQAKTEEKSQKSNASDVSKQDSASNQLSDYIDKGTTIEDALSSDTKIADAVPFAVNGKFALADEKGIPVTDAVYDDIRCFNTKNGIFWALYNGKTVTCINGSGKIIAYGENSDIKIFDDENIVIIGKNKSDVYGLDGKLKAQAKGKAVSLNDSVLVSRSTAKDKEKWYITDVQTGESHRVKNVKSICPFYDKNSVVQAAKKRWGTIDKNGEITELKSITKIKKSCGKYMLAKNSDGLFGIINTEGSEVMPFEYTNGKCLSTEQPIFQLWAEDGKSTVVNAGTNQKIKLPSSFNGENLTAYPSHYFSYVKEDGTVILFDDLVKLSFDSGSKLFGWNDNRIIVQNGDNCFTVNLRKGTTSNKQNVAYVPLTDKDMKSSSYFTVKDNDTGKQGICDENMKMVIDTEYDSIMPTGNSYFSAEKDGYSGLVNTKGDWILRLKNNNGG